MKKSLKVDPVKCVACRLCELACVFGREKVYNPKMARIKIHMVGIPELPAPVFTRLCDTCGGNPRCVAICPVNAITYEEDNPRPDQKTIPDHEEMVHSWLSQVMPKKPEEQGTES
jgi:Fe-S-cluster-containing hydrogenase component 2